MLREVLILLLALFELTSVASAEVIEDKSITSAEDAEADLISEKPSSFEETKMTFNFDQKVSGKGFFATHKYFLMPDALGTKGRHFNGVEAKDKAHGSGNVDSDSKIYAERSYTNKTWIDGYIDEDGKVVLDEEETSSTVQIREDSKMTHDALPMGVGLGYYSLHPVVFDSLIKKEDSMKNCNGYNSLYHMVDMAHGLDIELDAQSDATNNTLKVKEDLVNGRSHFGVLSLSGIPKYEAPEEDDSEESETLGLDLMSWRDPIVEIYQDYVGNFHIEKNMTLYTYEKEEEEEEPWLPCCMGGYEYIYPIYRRSLSAEGIFDCTCFQVPETR